MSEHAKVDSVDALRVLRAALVRFKDKAASALSDADCEIDRTHNWIEHEQLQYWKGRTHRCERLIQQARNALRRKQMFPTASGAPASTDDEERELARAKAQLQHAEQKVACVQRWSHTLRHEAHVYKGQVQPAAQAVEAELPAAIAALSNMVDSLDSYASLKAASRPEADFLTDGAATDVEAPPMSRDAHGAGASSGYRRLRQGTPDQANRDRTSIAEVVGAASPDDRETVPSGILARLGIEPVAAQPRDKVVLASGFSDRPCIYLERLRATTVGDSGWFIGCREEGRDEPYRAIPVADLIQLRPSLREILTLPPGYLVVLDGAHVEAILDERDDDVWELTP